MYARLKLQTAYRQIKKVRKKYASLDLLLRVSQMQSLKVLFYVRHEHKYCTHFHEIFLTHFV